MASSASPVSHFARFSRALGPFGAAQWLLGAAMWAAMHTPAWARPAFVALSLCALAAFVWEALVKRRDAAAWPALARVPLVLLVPGLYLVGLSVHYQSLGGVGPLASALGMLGFGAALITGILIGGSTDDFRPLFRGIAAAAGLVCAEALWRNYQVSAGTGWLFSIHRFYHTPDSYHTQMRLGSGTLPWAGFLAQWLLVATGCVLGLQSVEKRRPMQALWWGLIAVFAASIFLSGTRAVLVFFVLLLLLHAARKPGVQRWASLAGIAAGFGALFLLTLLKRGPIRGDGSLRWRLYMWQCALEIWRDHPLFGGGPQAFRERWPGWAAVRGYGSAPLADPHNLFLDLLTTGGAVTLGMALLLAGGMLWNLWKALTSGAPPGTKKLLYGLSLGVAAVLVSDVLSSAFHTGGVQLAALLLGGLVVGIRYRDLTVPGYSFQGKRSGASAVSRGWMCSGWSARVLSTYRNASYRSGRTDGT
jgi:hypothetical protein